MKCLEIGLQPTGYLWCKVVAPSLSSGIACSATTPDANAHSEQLRKWLLASQKGEVVRKIPELAQDFPPIRSSKTGRPPFYKRIVVFYMLQKVPGGTKYAWLVPYPQASLSRFLSWSQVPGLQL